MSVGVLAIGSNNTQSKEKLKSKSENLIDDALLIPKAYADCPPYLPRGTGLNLIRLKLKLELMKLGLGLHMSSLRGSVTFLGGGMPGDAL